MTVKRVCAWCKADMGSVEFHLNLLEDVVTSGICKACSDQVHKDWEAHVVSEQEASNG